MASPEADDCSSDIDPFLGVVADIVRKEDYIEEISESQDYRCALGVCLSLRRRFPLSYSEPEPVDRLYEINEFLPSGLVSACDDYVVTYFEDHPANDDLVLGKFYSLFFDSFSLALIEVDFEALESIFGMGNGEGMTLFDEDKTGGELAIEVSRVMENKESYSGRERKVNKAMAVAAKDYSIMVREIKDLEEFGP